MDCLIIRQKGFDPYQEDLLRLRISIENRVYEVTLRSINFKVPKGIKRAINFCRAHHLSLESTCNMLSILKESLGVNFVSKSNSVKKALTDIHNKESLRRKAFKDALFITEATGETLSLEEIENEIRRDYTLLEAYERSVGPLDFDVRELIRTFWSKFHHIPIQLGRDRGEKARCHILRLVNSIPPFPDRRLSREEIEAICLERYTQFLEALPDFTLNIHLKDSDFRETLRSFFLYQFSYIGPAFFKLKMYILLKSYDRDQYKNDFTWLTGFDKALLASFGAGVDYQDSIYIGKPTAYVAIELLFEQVLLRDSATVFSKPEVIEKLCNADLAMALAANLTCRDEEKWILNSICEFWEMIQSRDDSLETLEEIKHEVARFAISAINRMELPLIASVSFDHCDTPGLMHMFSLNCKYHFLKKGADAEPSRSDDIIRNYGLSLLSLLKPYLIFRGLNATQFGRLQVVETTYEKTIFAAFELFFYEDGRLSCQTLEVSSESAHITKIIKNAEKSSAKFIPLIPAIGIL